MADVVPLKLIKQLDGLLSQLNITGLQQTNNALYQVIAQLIKNVRLGFSQLDNNVTVISGGGGTVTTTFTYLTENDESAALPNSRRVLAGERISFDDSVANIRIENVDQFLTVDVSRISECPLTDGDLVSPVLIFADGDTICGTNIFTELLFAGGEPVTVAV